jgi:membrane-bound lytic murein transglycosylase D
MRLLFCNPIRYCMKLNRTTLVALLVILSLVTSSAAAQLVRMPLPAAPLTTENLITDSVPGESTPVVAEFPDLLKGNEAYIADYIETFSVNRRDYLIRSYLRDARYSNKIVPILQRYAIPVELRVLVTLESGFNPYAKSRAGAYGYWQFMDATAKEYGLAIRETVTVKVKKKGQKPLTKKVTSKRDDRSNLYRSTAAAARYLRDRRKNLGDDWLLIVASYNYGIGNVWQVIEDSGLEHPTFWDIKDKLPAETRNYVMNFIALNVIFHNYDSFVNNQLVFTSQPAVEPSTAVAQPAVLVEQPLEDRQQ